MPVNHLHTLAIHAGEEDESLPDVAAPLRMANTFRYASFAEAARLRNGAPHLHVGAIPPPRARSEGCHVEGVRQRRHRFRWLRLAQRCSPKAGDQSLPPRALWRHV